MLDKTYRVVLRLIVGIVLAVIIEVLRIL